MNNMEEGKVESCVEVLQLLALEVKIIMRIISNLAALLMLKYKNTAHKDVPGSGITANMYMYSELIS